MSHELQTSSDTLQARLDELTVHLIEGESYLTDERKDDIRREIGRICFELDQRAGE